MTNMKKEYFPPSILIKQMSFADILTESNAMPILKSSSKKLDKLNLFWLDEDISNDNFDDAADDF